MIEKNILILKKNLKEAIKKSGMYVKEVATKSGVKKRTIDKWLSTEEIEPKVIDFYKVCSILGITVEWIITGNQGCDIITQKTTYDDLKSRSLERLQQIVNVLQELDQNTLEIVEKMIISLKKDNEK